MLPALAFQGLIATISMTSTSVGHVLQDSQETASNVVRPMILVIPTLVILEWLV